jgi:hypothetical protein
MSEYELLFVKFMMSLYMTSFYMSVITIGLYIYIWIVTELYIRENGIHTIAAWLRS